jgi:hypothetical protein
LKRTKKIWGLEIYNTSLMGADIEEEKNSILLNDVLDFT